MKYVLLAAYNTFLGVYMPPNFVNEMTDDDIRESHRRSVLMGKVPDQGENIVIFRLGSFDDTTGETVLEKKPVRICSLAEFLPRKVNTEENQNVSESNSN